MGDGRWVGTEASERFPIYTRSNAGEVYPLVYRPLSLSIAQEAGERAMRRAILRSGLVRPSELDGIALSTGIGSGVFGGYAYLNLSIQRLIAARVPGSSATDADESFLGVGDPPPHTPLDGERNIRASLRDATTDDLLERFSTWFETHLSVSFAAGALMSLLNQLCKSFFDDMTLATRLMSGLGDVDSAAPSHGMWSLGRMIAASATLTSILDDGVPGVLSRLQSVASGGNDDAVDFVAEFEEFVAEFGSRGPNEWDTAFDTWEPDPELALTLVDRMRLTDDSHARAAQHDRLLAERIDLEAQVVGRLAGRLKAANAAACAALGSTAHAEPGTRQVDDRQSDPRCMVESTGTRSPPHRAKRGRMR